MANESISMRGIGLWAVTGLVSLLFMLLFAIVIWPREATMEEKLSKGQAKSEALSLLREGYRAHLIDEFEHAIDLYNRALERDASVTQAVYMRASARLSIGDYDGADEDFSFIVDIAPYFAPALNSRGVIRHRRGDVEGALEDFDRAIELDPTFANPLVNRAYVKKEQGDARGAMRELDAAHDIRPNSKWILDSRGVLKYEQEDIEGALEDFTRAMQIPKGEAPHEYANIYRNRAAIRREQGDLEGAAEDLARFEELSN